MQTWRGGGFLGNGVGIGTIVRGMLPCAPAVRPAVRGTIVIAIAMAATIAVPIDAAIGGEWNDGQRAQAGNLAHPRA